MAVTAIWRVKGRLDKVINYAENPEKTTMFENNGLSSLIRYAVNSDKTEAIDDESIEVVRSFVSGVNCFPSTAIDEMIAVKKHFGKTEGVIAYHGYQSFALGEVTPEISHEIGIKLAEKLWGERYQVVVATHLDKANHLHNHFVVNNVSFIDGIKYHRTGKDYREMWTASDELCREYGLSVLDIDNPHGGKHKKYGEWRAEQEDRPTWRKIIREDVDQCINKSMSESQFFINLKKDGYEIKLGKDISVRPPGKERFVRLARNFGDNYSIDGIRQRILEKQMLIPCLPACEPKTKKLVYRGDLKKAKRATGFRALYFYYCYLLGYFPQKRAQNNKRMHFLLREDLIKMEQISKEARLLSRNHIDTEQQLSSYRETLEVKLEELIKQRKKLYPKRNDLSVKNELTKISVEISTIRKEMHLCDDIAVRSGIIREKLNFICKEKTGKEKTEDDKLR